MTGQEIKGTLEKQLQLLSKRSNEIGTQTDELCEISHAMVEIFATLGGKELEIT